MFETIYLVINSNFHMHTDIDVYKWHTYDSQWKWLLSHAEGKWTLIGYDQNVQWYNKHILPALG